MWGIYLVLIIGGVVVLAAAALLPQILSANRGERTEAGFMPPGIADLDRAVANLETELRQDLEAAEAFARDPTADKLRDDEDESVQAWPPS